MAELALAPELLQQLRSARQWLKVLIDEFEIDPPEAAFIVNAEHLACGSREVARVTLEDSLKKIDAAIERGHTELEAADA